MTQEEKDQKDMDAMFKSQLGFTAVIKIMKEAKKPLIGHNMVYDAGFIFQQFIDDLPETFDEFRDEWRQVFPMTYDTKVFCLDSGSSGKTDLEALFSKCTNGKNFKGHVNFELDPQIVNPEKFKEMAHEAAFDAYMTGVCFASISKYIEIRPLLQKIED